MDHYIGAASQYQAQLLAGNVPLLLEILIRNSLINDGKMEPLHLTARYFLAKALHSQQRKFVRLQKCNDGNRSPIADCIEIDGEITVPCSGICVRVEFAWAESDANSSMPRYA
jgi:hypothetical protein